MDDAAATGRDHRRQQRAAHQEGAADIDREHLVPVGETEIEHAAVGIVSGGAVDQHVDLQERLERGLRGGIDLALAGDIAGDGDRVGA